VADGTGRRRRKTDGPARGAEDPVRGSRYVADGTGRRRRKTDGPARGAEDPVRGSRYVADGTGRRRRKTDGPARGAEDPVRGSRYVADGTGRRRRKTVGLARGAEDPVRCSRYVADGTGRDDGDGRRLVSPVGRRTRYVAIGTWLTGWYEGRTRTRTVGQQVERQASIVRVKLFINKVQDGETGHQGIIRASARGRHESLCTNTVILPVVSRRLVGWTVGSAVVRWNLTARVAATGVSKAHAGEHMIGWIPLASTSGQPVSTTCSQVGRQQSERRSQGKRWKRWR
jgi:hypothetical protein